MAFEAIAKPVVVLFLFGERPAFRCGLGAGSLKLAGDAPLFVGDSALVCALFSGMRGDHLIAPE